MQERILEIVWILYSSRLDEGHIWRRPLLI